MRWVVALCLALGILAVGGCKTQSARIAKVLPHYLDHQGRHTPAPSLFERDAHQAYLRANPEEIGGLRFDIHWNSTYYTVTGVRLRLELRGSKDPQTLVLEEAIEKRPWYQRWTAIELDRETFDQLGEVVAWRATLWEGDRLLAERQSFLW